MGYPYQIKENSHSVFDVFFDIFLFIMGLGVTAYILSQFLPAVSTYISSAIFTPFNNSINSLFGYADASMFIFLIFVFGIEALSSYENPKKSKALLNVVVLFFLGYMFNQLSVIFTSFSTTLSLDTLLPYTTTFITSNYLLIVLMFFLVLNIILNFRTKREGVNYGY